MIDDIDATTARVLLGLDGRRSRETVLAEAGAAGADIAVVSTLLAGLRRCDLVVDAEPLELSALGGPDTAERLAPDHSGLSVSGVAAPLATLRHRRARMVAVHNTGRLGAPVASLLAAAGVGTIRLVDDEMARPSDAAPGGLLPMDSFTPRRAGAAAAVRRAAPEVRLDTAASGETPDLVVLAGCTPVEPVLLRSLHRLGVSHLAVSIRESTAVVGPLVVPGTTSCLTCADLQRRDRDPAWPRLAAQLSVRRRRMSEPGEVTLTMMAAALATAQALLWLDGGTTPTLGGTLELRTSAPQIQRRNWVPHPHCPCGAGRTAPRRPPERAAGPSDGTRTCAMRPAPDRMGP
ncbi:MAG: TOMM precursor leader peptide-binding protein [Actinobacteria bacterium]|nr:TOMM precursor leader peptide-binding protein [Actinomycetota bacterium]MBI3688579.1 TOMM precursor leader peptide-binding protein [Actinomycetota bacterium]